MLKKLWQWITGAAPKPSDWQIGEKLVTMREDRDCHVAAVATACGVAYEQARKALWHWNMLWLLESPLLSNPYNVKRGVQALGFSVRELAGYSELGAGEMAPGKVILLTHEPSSEISGTLNQHWVVWMGKVGDMHQLHWGQSQEPRYVTASQLFNLYRTGWPNCCFEIKKV